MIAPTEIEIEEVAADLVKRFTDQKLCEMLTDLFKQGRIVDSGRRHADGSIVWVAADISPRH